MEKYSFCPNCQIGLNSREMEMRFCQNCKHDWEDEDTDYEEVEDEDFDDEYEELQRQADEEINDINDW